MPTLAANPAIYEYTQARSNLATKHYHAHYSNALYLEAIAGKSVERANFLINRALSLCGDPYYVADLYAEYDDAEIRFLEAFVPAVFRLPYLIGE